MQNEKWIFYTDLFGRQRWERISTQGYTLSESNRAFDTVAQAVADASVHGYVQSEDPNTWALEWRVKSVRASTAQTLLRPA